ncbi:hypothetical protein GN157_05070 [Flavobacterium rakeshii]|uniref:DUF4595 domain-containing protein n=1 Tax=Flavobacterium rakeshii TaxID=1038845 RepID=A0A6N8HBZ7_9FLAO|nr:hypothetical protein [Flavobacterium rakeshii]MUV03075.1 hypothetical protein [Flavobacterium rakeshii]
MKLRLLALSFFIVLMSCSSDDSTDPENENPNPEQPTEPVDKVMTQIEIIYHDDFSYKRSVTQYEDGKPVSSVNYDDNDNIMVTGTYTYNSSGYLTSIDALKADGTIDNTTEYQYDEQGRLMGYIQDGEEAYGALQTKYYTYNDDNTITCTRTFDTFVYVTTFFVNENGKIYSIKDETDNDNNERYDAQYNSQGDNIITVSTISDYGVTSIVNYNYNYNQEVKGSYLGRNKLYGGFNNNILRAESFNMDYLVLTSYPVSYINENGPDNYYDYEYHYNYIYEFDEYGYPVKVKKYYDGVYNTEIIITYE